MYPDALFPSVYFGVGVFNNGGKSLSQGIYIGAEFYTPDAETPTDELTPYLRQVRGGPARLPSIVAHELVHQQQQYRNQNTLLADAIAEGSADFLAELATGNVATGGTTYAFGQANERTVWLRFKQDMDGSTRQNWLYNGFSGNPYSFPPDMGYFVGYKICAAYYNRASDKTAALRTMLTTSDVKAFLTQSGYGDQF